MLEVLAGTNEFASHSRVLIARRLTRVALVRSPSLIPLLCSPSFAPSLTHQPTTQYFQQAMEKQRAMGDHRSLGGACVNLANLLIAEASVGPAAG